MRPRLEEANPRLAIRAMKLATSFGIKKGAEIAGISKNTMKAMLKRRDMMWLVRCAALDRKLARVLGIKL